MFRGNHPTRVDEKGRLKLPAEFKRRVDEVYGPLFYITSMDGKGPGLSTEGVGGD
jgi:MraZ protein